jgi:tRNA threonylcarbamoyladenosine biosynthesis protein TsaB
MAAMGDPRILAIETAGQAGSLCVARGDAVVGRASLPGDTRHASGLHTAIDRLVRGQGWEPDGLDEVYVSAGPGSFTGARIGITVARTLAWATAATLVRVPTMDALARNAVEGELRPRFVAVALDAKRRQIYGALYRIGADGAFTCEAAPRMIAPDVFLREAMAHLGVPPAEIAVLGEGVPAHREAIERVGATILPEVLWASRAEQVLAVGRAMAARGEHCSPRECVPIYIRLPEPEEKWRARQAKQAQQQ